MNTKNKNKLEESIKAFEKLLNTISDEKFNSLVDKINTKHNNKDK